MKLRPTKEQIVTLQLEKRFIRDALDVDLYFELEHDLGEWLEDQFTIFVSRGFNGCVMITQLKNWNDALTFAVDFRTGIEFQKLR